MLFGATLADSYSNNGLKYSYLKDDTKNIDVTYVQVSGLKNDIVQESINNQIKERINKIVDSNNFKNNSDNTAYIKSTVESNFSDVLSIKIFARFREDYNKCYGLNFRLDTGEKIKLNDLFVHNAPKRNIITQVAYRTFALSYYTEDGIMNDFYYNIEDDIVSFLKNYNDGKITEFSFSPLGIELYKDGKTVTINMLDWYKYIAIYSKFVAKTNLYTNTENTATKIPIFVKRPESIIDLYEKVNDSCIIDVIIYGDEQFNQKENKTIENYKNELEKKLEEVKKEKGLYYSNYIKVSKGKENDENILIFDEYESYAQVDENDFANAVYNKIMEAERNIDNLDYKASKVAVIEKGLLHSAIGQTKYSVKTGKEYVFEEPVEEEDEEKEEREHQQEERNREQEERENEEVERQIQEALRQSETSSDNRNNNNNNNQTPNTTVQPTETPQSVITTVPTPQAGNITTQVIF